MEIQRIIVVEGVVLTPCIQWIVRGHGRKCWAADLHSALHNFQTIRNTPGYQYISFEYGWSSGGEGVRGRGGDTLERAFVR